MCAAFRILNFKPDLIAFIAKFSCVSFIFVAIVVMEKTRIEDIGSKCYAKWPG